MIYSLTGFPFDLLWAIVIAFIFSPRIGLPVIVIATVAMLVPGFFIPMPYRLMFWSPGGAASVIAATSIILWALTRQTWFSGHPVEPPPDRRKVREELFKIESVEERQQEYIRQIQKNAVAFENANNHVLLPNTFFFLVSFILVFLVDFSAVAAIHITNPDLLKKLFGEVYQTIIVSPGTFDAWFSALIELGALHIFVFNIVFFLLLLRMIDTILQYRKIRQPLIGTMAFFQLPFVSIWFYIASGVFFFVTIKTGQTGVTYFAAKNLFFIFSTLYIFQGISILWLFLQVRLLPTGGIVIAMVLMAFMFELIGVLVFSFFILIGLLDFWFDFRKKALHPNLFSDGV